MGRKSVKQKEKEFLEKSKAKIETEHTYVAQKSNMDIAYDYAIKHFPNNNTRIENGVLKFDVLGYAEYDKIKDSILKILNVKKIPFSIGFIIYEDKDKFYKKKTIQNNLENNKYNINNNDKGVTENE